MKACNCRTIGEWHKTIKCIKTNDTNTHKQIMTGGLLNSQSAVNKAKTIKSELFINDLHFLGLTETCIKEDDNHSKSPLSKWIQGQNHFQEK